MPGRIHHSLCSARALALTLGALLSASAASAQGFEDPVSIAWKFGYGLSDAAYHAAWQDYADDGYLPIQIEMDNGGAIYSGVWQKNTDGRGWVSWRRLTSAQFHQYWDEYRQKGFRPIDQGSEVIGGTLNDGRSTVRVEVTAVGENTALAGIRRLVEEAKASKSSTQLLADRAAAFLFYAALAAAAVTAVVWTIVEGGPSQEMVARVVTVLVIACPHALGLAVPLVVSITTSIAARNGTLIRSREAIDTGLT